MNESTLWSRHPLASWIPLKLRAGRGNSIQGAGLTKLLYRSKRPAKACIVPLLLAAVWELATGFGLVAPQTLPPPRQVLSTLAGLLQSGELLIHMLVSLQRVLLGCAWGIPLGALLGFAMGRYKRLEIAIYPTFRALSQVPNLAWIPLFMMFVGIGEELQLLIVAKAAVVPLAINTYQGIRYVPNSYLEVARLYQLTRMQVIRQAYLPAAMPQILAGLRSSLNHAWLALVIVELLSSSEGLGFLMVWGRQLFQMDLVMAAMIMLGLTGLGLDLLLRAWETRLLHWQAVKPRGRSA